MTKILDLDATPEDTARLFGERLKRLRLDKRLSQVELASSVGMTTAYVSRVERGTANPTLEAMLKLADAVGGKVWEMVQPEAASSTG